MAPTVSPWVQIFLSAALAYLLIGEFHEKQTHLISRQVTIVNLHELSMEEISEIRNFTARDILCIVGVEGCLGSGSFGVVRCVFHPSLGWIAVKCFSVCGGMSANDLVVQEFKNELSAMQQANHENILRVYGWAQWEGSVALVTELMSAGNLRLILGNYNVPLHPVLRLRMCKEISHGIAFIHNFSSMKRLTHGDLKPENILLTSDLHCKVGDFGSARVVHYTGLTTTTNGNRQKLQVTPVYAAPERLRKLSCRPKKEQDTYSYGLIVHGLLSRETPSQYCTSEREFLEGIKRGERPDTDAIDELEESLTTNEEREIIQVLRSVMIRCWQDAPTDRPDMRDVRDQLQQLMSKQKPSDVMRSVGEALDKMTIRVPEQARHRCLPLNCFNPQTRTFLDDSPREGNESRVTESLVHSPTTGSADESSSNGFSEEMLENEITDVSTTSATVASISNTSLTDAIRVRRTTRSENSDSKNSTATIISITDSSYADITRSEHVHRIIEWTAHPSTITSMVDARNETTMPKCHGGPATVFGNQTKGSIEQTSENKETNFPTTAATIGSIADTSTSDISSRSRESGSSEWSTAAATITPTADASLSASRTNELLNNWANHADHFASLMKTANISQDITKSPDAKKDLEKQNRKHLAATEELGRTCGRIITLDDVFNTFDRPRLPKEVREAPNLLENYESSLATGNTEVATEIMKDIIMIMKKEIISTGWKLLKFARELRKAERYLESIPFYVASASQYKQEGGEDSVVGMKWCVWAMCEVNKGLVDSETSMIKVVKDHVIPLMRDIKDDMEKMTSVREETKCWEVVWALESIGSSEELIFEIDDAVETHKERLSRVKKTFGDETDKHWIYGGVLVSLGDFNKQISRFDDATSCYQLAIEVFKAATDFLDQKQRQYLIKSCEKKLKELQ